MLKSLLRDRPLIILLVLALAIRLLAFSESAVEAGYSQTIYPHLSASFRALIGWIPFSIGDLLYLSAGIYLLVKVIKYLRLLFKRTLRPHLNSRLLIKTLRLIFGIYVVFNLFWGLNYNRQGIAHQLGLHVTTYDTATLYTLTVDLAERLTWFSQFIDSTERNKLNENDTLFRMAKQDYADAEKRFSFLKYRYPSIKASLFGVNGKYFGYTGYYNPFTGEAQLKTSIPVFLKSFVVNHEIAHQLGYAKENEASFVSYLVSKSSNDVYAIYSAYYELFFEAFYEWLRKGSRERARLIYLSLPQRVRYDRHEEMAYLRQSSNPVAPFMSVAYDRYLRMNNQPKGKATYDEVIAWLIAYRNRFGREAL